MSTSTLNTSSNTDHRLARLSNKYKSSFSTVDALLQFLTSVSAIQTTEDCVFREEDGTYLSHKPVVFIVCTGLILKLIQFFIK